MGQGDRGLEARVTAAGRNSARGIAVVAILLGVLWGIMLGAGVFTFGYAKGGAYLTDDPAACANCHVMRDQYSGWLKASHRKAAVCNDCHAPAGFFPKYATKAINGFFHSLAFTTGRFPDQILITERNLRVTREACLKCHAEITSAIGMARPHDARMDCLRCHGNVGHKEE